MQLETAIILYISCDLVSGWRHSLTFKDGDSYEVFDTTLQKYREEREKGAFMLDLKNDDDESAIIGEFIPFLQGISNDSQFLNHQVPWISTLDLIRSQGYPVEAHHVVSADGYILEMHRMPRPGAPVVFLHHGVLSNSALFVLLGPRYSLAHAFWHAGYDVWLGNARGNTYSRRHVQLKPEEPQFWNFSWHEMGLYDLPVEMNYVLNVTGRKDVTYVCHSMGCTMILVLTSQRPEWNSLVRTVHAIAPAALLTSTPSSSIFMCRKLRVLLEALNKAKYFELFLQTSGIRKEAMEIALSHPEKLLKLYEITCGDSSLDPSKILFYLNFFPDSTSIKTVLHLHQLIDTDALNMFDYGPKENFEKYGCSIPPQYDLCKVTVPVYFYVATEDNLTPIHDVQRLSHRLINSKGVKRLIFNESVNHLDLFLLPSMRELLYDTIISEMS